MLGDRHWCSKCYLDVYEHLPDENGKCKAADCGYVCRHTGNWDSTTGTCKVCGFEHAHIEYIEVDGICYGCVVCGFAHTHGAWKKVDGNAEQHQCGSETNCHYLGNHCWNNGKCTETLCGYTCTHDTAKGWTCDETTGACNTCGVSHEHDLKDGICQTCGYIACNKVLAKQQEVAKLPHTEVIDNAVAPTCAVAGLTEGKHCSVCGAVIVKQEVIPATGHSLIGGYDPKQHAISFHCTSCGYTRKASFASIF